MKVLLFTHNPITTYQNTGKTFASLFSAFKEEELCQLYLYPTIPDYKRCHSYYRMTDKAVLKSYLRFFQVKGEEITDWQIERAKASMFEREEDAKVYRNVKNKRPFRRLLRDSMWKYTHWFNKGLKAWIEREQPTHLFVAPGTGKFVYKMALKIAKKYDLPIITYVCDEYYFVQKPKTFWGKIQVKSLQKQIKKLCQKSALILTICKQLEECYQKEFGTPCKTVMTGASFPVAERVKTVQAPTQLTYMGNILMNRYRSLAEIGQALDELNAEGNCNFRLNLYTATTREDVLAQLRPHPSIQLCGFLSGEEYKNTFFSSQILLHTESFLPESIDEVKHSVSTKIADSLASGICLFAYGPDCVASMEHLIDNECAVCATSREQLKERLKALFTDGGLRTKIAERGIRVAQTYHDSEKNGRAVYEAFEEIK